MAQSGNIEIKKTLDLLNQGENKTVPRDDIVLMLGTTGSGKSTSLLFLTGDNSKLRSVEQGEDSNEFIIVDDYKISNDTITSQTIFPELMYDNETKTNYYDCPGFSDTRSTSHDIAATYLIKKLLDRAKRIKIVFVISYPHVQMGVDRKGFTELLTHATTLITNVKKYKPSLSLLVTKVNNDYRRGGRELVPDSVMINKIAFFLNSVKGSLNELQKTDPTDKNQKLYRDGEQVLDAFLKRDNNVYSNIAIFRRPDEPGPLDKIELLQKSKRAIKTMVQNLVFTPVSVADFSYTISDKSKNDIFDLNEQFNNEIFRNLMMLSREIDTFANNKISTFNNMKRLQQLLKKQITSAWPIIDNAGNESNLHKLFIMQLNLLETLQVNLNSPTLTNISNLISYIDFLQQVDKQRLISRPSEWKQSFMAMIKPYQAFKDWIDFVYNINSHLELYETQIGRNNINTIKNDINPNNLVTFLNEIKAATGKDYDFVRRLQLDGRKYQLLNDVIRFVVRTPPQMDCSQSNKLIVRGNYIKISDVLKMRCQHGAKTMEIYASRIIYIDTDINETGKQTNLIIIAPVWNVIGAKQFLLNGGDAPALAAAIAPPNQDGVPGNPGGPAGNFFGVAGKILGGENLKIFTNGGRGSQGQQGAAGLTGANGSLKGKPGGKRFHGCPGHRDGFDRTSDGTYEAYGSPGANGGRGWNGGVGGLGGFEGQINLFQLTASAPVQLQTLKGPQGAHGAGGAGGLGGYQYKIKARCNVHKELFGAIKRATWDLIGHIEHKRSPTGEFGTTGGNSAGIVQPTKNNDLINKAVSVSTYEQFMKTIIPNQFMKEDTFEFLIKMESNHGKLGAPNSAAIQNQFNAEKNIGTGYISPYKALREKASVIKRRRRSILHTNKLITETNSHLKHNLLVDSVYQYRPMLDSSSSNNKLTINYNNCDLNSNLMLINMLISKFTDKTMYNAIDSNIDWNMNAQIMTLNIIDELEKQTNFDKTNFNPVQLQTDIYQSIIKNNNFSQISNIIKNHLC